MRHRLDASLTNRATIEREEEVDEDDLDNPITDDVTIAEDVACAFEDEGTEFVRGDSGERVRTPATVTFAHDADLEEGDTVSIDGVGEFEAVSVTVTRDFRRGTTISVEAELEDK